MRREDHRTIESSEIERMHAESVLPAVLKSMQLHTQKVQHSRRIRHVHNPITASCVGLAISGVGYYMASGDDCYKSCNFLPGHLQNNSRKPDHKITAGKQKAALSCRRKKRCSPTIASGHLVPFLHPYYFARSLSSQKRTKASILSARSFGPSSMSGASTIYACNSRVKIGASKALHFHHTNFAGIYFMRM